MCNIPSRCWQHVKQSFQDLGNKQHKARFSFISWFTGFFFSDLGSGGGGGGGGGGLVIFELFFSQSFFFFFLISPEKTVKLVR